MVDIKEEKDIKNIKVIKYLLVCPNGLGNQLQPDLWGFDPLH